MHMKILPFAILAFFLATGANAQSKDKIKKEENIIIRKKGDTKEKTTIVIDGDNITINGKPLEDMKDADIQVLRNRDILPLLPGIKGRIAGPIGGMKMFGDDFMMHSNSAFLGVASEKTEKGLKIISVEKESAAEKAGLKKEDIITKVGDKKIESSNDLYEAIGSYKPEEKVTITYLRDGKENNTTATLGKSISSPKIFKFKGGDFSNDVNRDFNFKMPNLPDMEGMNFSYNRKPRLGVQIQDLSEGKGVKILDVDSESAAAKAGLQKDDVISEIDGSAVASVDELRNKLRDLKEGDSIKLTYQRNGKTQSIDIKFPKKLKTAEL